MESLLNKPFSCTYSGTTPKILKHLNCSILLSTYQAGKLLVLSANEHGQKLVQLARHFERPMGIAIEGDKMAIATKQNITILKNSAGLAKSYKANPNTYDALYMPRTTYHTGGIDLHDLSFGKDGVLWGVNTRFSCICNFNSEYSFIPRWKPNFITELFPQDRCHLNGMAMAEGLPFFVTALGATNTPNGWRENKANGGILMNVKTQEVILEGLSMPHSPRVYNNRLYVLESGRGHLLQVDPANKKSVVLCDLGGFARGMKKIENFLFIGISKIRSTSKDFQNLQVAERAKHSGVVIYDMQQEKIVGEITYNNSVDEIYDVQIVPNKNRINVLNTHKDTYRLGIHTKFGNFWMNPEEQKK